MVWHVRWNLWQGLHFFQTRYGDFFFFPIFSVGIRLVGVWEIFLRASVSYSTVSFVLLHLILVNVSVVQLFSLFSRSFN